jgi:cellulose synthase/poly-beta-1,6-N-acetylglucosamine synthase-like glycosyltransferase
LARSSVVEMPPSRLVSVIIPCKYVGNNALECVSHLSALTYSAYEILLLPDYAIEAKLPGVRVIPTGEVPPSVKRDLAAKHANGEILAFIDDDAFPRPDWLDHAVVPFDDESVGAVGGPGVTPSADGILEQASGLVLQSWLGSGPHAYRYTPGHRMDVDDYPSCNLLVRKSTFNAAGGFETNYWPGEDTKLCLSITNELRQRIVYEPDALVYHHRRSIFGGHVSQVRSYGLHRGFFVKKYPATSRRLSYFMPTLFALGLVAGIPLLLIPILGAIYLFTIALYLTSVLVSSAMVTRHAVAMFPLVFVGTVLTHIVYGTAFLRGLLARDLAR